MLRIGNEPVFETGAGSLAFRVPGAYLSEYDIPVGAKMHFGVDLGGTMRYHLKGNDYRKPMTLQQNGARSFLIIPRTEADKRGIEKGTEVQLRVERETGCLVVKPVRTGD
jgi:predicted molibdopterin-dependent oxidoreductase YjgC